MRFVVAILCLVIGRAHAGNPADSEVRVERKSGGFIECGSGTVVWSGSGKSWVVTNYHVATDSGTVTVYHAGKAYTARHLGWDAGLDLCGLEVEASLPAVEVAKEPVRPGEKVRQWGHAGGSHAAIPKEGAWVGETGRRVGGGPACETTIDAQSGDSGSGVFSARGQLVAVCWGRRTDRPGQICVSLADVRRFLNLGE